MFQVQHQMVWTRNFKFFSINLPKFTMCASPQQCFQYELYSSWWGTKKFVWWPWDKFDKWNANYRFYQDDQGLVFDILSNWQKSFLHFLNQPKSEPLLKYFYRALISELKYLYVDHLWLCRIQLTIYIRRLFY